MYLTKQVYFDAAHHLPQHSGNCKNVHGHRWKIEATISGFIKFYSPNLSDNMVMDFSDFKESLEYAVVSQYDHKDLNSRFEFPTAEAISMKIYSDLKRNLPEEFTLESVKVWETDTSFVEYRGECFYER